MQEYKREKSKLEVRIQEIQQKSIHHDDHVRVIDAWLLQVRLSYREMNERMLMKSSYCKR
jgi:hypothetical protein